METINELIFDLWKHTLPLPVFLRQVIFLFVTLFLVRVILMRLVPFIIKLVTRLIAFLLDKWVGMCSWFVYVLMRARRKQDKAMPSFINGVEHSFDVMIDGTLKLAKVYQKRPKFRTKFKRTYKLISLIIIIGFPFFYYSQPEQPVAQKWNDVEGWMLGGRVIASTYASEPAVAETDEQATGVWVRLRPDEQGVKLRDQPSLNSNQIGTLGIGQRARYLNQEQEGDGINWLFIEMEDGTQGWVSNNIAERYEE